METDRLLENNASFAAEFDRAHLPVEPALRLAVVTCMDSRLDVLAALGLGDGEAHILRNAGGVITDDVIRSLALSQRKLGTREIVLIHHTDCGLEKVTDDGFRAELQEATGMAPPFAIESFTDVDEDVRQSLARVRGSAFLQHTDRVRGFVYDVDSGRLREVDGQGSDRDALRLVVGAPPEAANTLEMTAEHLRSLYPDGPRALPPELGGGTFEPDESEEGAGEPRRTRK